MTDHTERVAWVDPRAKDRVGGSVSANAMLALVRGPVGASPILFPPSNGIKEGGVLRFTDWSGDIQEARVGDEIEMTTAGWVLHKRSQT